MIYPSLASSLREQHRTLAAIMKPLSAERKQRRTPGGAWSIIENLVHLTRYQTIYLERVRRILAEDGPRFDRYRADDDPGFLALAGVPESNLWEEFMETRQEIVDHVLTLSEASLGRRGVHPRFGDLDLVQWTAFFILHEAHHQYTIFQLATDVNF